MFESLKAACLKEKSLILFYSVISFQISKSDNHQIIH